MFGAVVMAIVIVFAIPVGFLMSNALAAGVLGYLLTTGAEEAAESSDTAVGSGSEPEG